MRLDLFWEPDSRNSLLATPPVFREPNWLRRKNTFVLNFFTMTYFFRAQATAWLIDLIDLFCQEISQSKTWTTGHISEWGIYYLFIYVWFVFNWMNKPAYLFTTTVLAISDKKNYYFILIFLKTDGLWFGHDVFAMCSWISKILSSLYSVYIIGD